MTFFFFSTMFKADPLDFLFSILSFSLLPFISVLSSFSLKCPLLEVIMSESAFSQSVSVTHVCVVMFVLSRIKGVELHRNWHLEVMRHMIWQREQTRLVIFSLLVKPKKPKLHADVRTYCCMIFWHNKCIHS